MVNRENATAFLGDRFKPMLADFAKEPSRSALFGSKMIDHVQGYGQTLRALDKVMRAEHKVTMFVMIDHLDQRYRWFATRRGSGPQLPETLSAGGVDSWVGITSHDGSG